MFGILFISDMGYSTVLYYHTIGKITGQFKYKVIPTAYECIPLGRAFTVQYRLLLGLGDF